jgi:hypothetical protein
MGCTRKFRGLRLQPAIRVGCRGEPAVVIMSVQDFIDTVAPPHDWLEKAWSGAKRRGLDTLMPADIDAEITAHRRKQDPITPGGVK